MPLGGIEPLSVRPDRVKELRAGAATDRPPTPGLGCYISQHGFQCVSWDATVGFRSHQLVRLG